MEKIVEETHDEKKINVSRDFINYNVGFWIQDPTYSKDQYEEV